MRKGLGKKIRFEVFKRDSFTCQYCGAKAPDVLLHADHVTPVAEGGGDDLLNLVTACSACNLGKGARPLSDDSAIAKQRAQLEELQDKREQIDMMLQWQRGLSDLRNVELEAVVERVNEHLSTTGRSATEHGIGTLKKHLRKYGLSELLTAVDIAFDHYADPPTAFEKIGGIAHNRKAEREDPAHTAKRRVGAAASKQFAHWSDREGKSLVGEAVSVGISAEWLVRAVYSERNWSGWRSLVERTIEEMRAKLGEVHQ